LRNLKQRLEALYGQAHQLEIQNRPEGGLCVRVRIPLENSSSPRTE